MVRVDKYAGQKPASILVRVDPSLYAQIKAEATENLRDLGPQIVYGYTRYLAARERHAARKRAGQTASAQPSETLSA